MSVRTATREPRISAERVPAERQIPRFFTFVAVLACCLLVIVQRLVQLQIVQGEAFAAAAVRLRSCRVNLRARRMNFVLRTASLLVLLAVWQIGSLHFGPQLLPPPHFRSALHLFPATRRVDPSNLACTPPAPEPTQHTIHAARTPALHQSLAPSAPPASGLHVSLCSVRARVEHPPTDRS